MLVVYTLANSIGNPRPSIRGEGEVMKETGRRPRVSPCQTLRGGHVALPGFQRSSKSSPVNLKGFGESHGFRVVRVYGLQG